MENTDFMNPKRLSTHEERAMNLSFGASFLMLIIKWYAYVITGSAAIFSDAAETIVHLVAVGFAAYSLRVAYRPPDEDHHFGHDKIAFFSSGVEGALIIFAAIVIIYTAVQKWMTGIVLEDLGFGTFLTAFAGGINLILGLFLVRTGKRHDSLILVANGKHILTDSWTSGGVVIGLLLALFTGFLAFDPIFAILSALNILWEGGKLVYNAVDGLMDKTNATLEQKALETLQEFCINHEITFHRLRLRESAARVYVDFHLQFPDGTLIENAHTIATKAEEAIEAIVGREADVFSHLESIHPPDHK